MEIKPKIKINKEIKNQLLRAITGVAGIKLLSTLITLFNGILWARILGPESYGFYIFVLSVVVLLGLPTQGGLPTLVMREVAIYKYDESWTKLRGILLASNAFVIFFSALAGFLAYLYIQFFIDNGAKSAAFLWSLLLLPFIAFANVRMAILKGFKKVIRANIPEQIVKPLITLSLLSITYFIGYDLTVVGAIHYTTIAVACSFLVGVVLLLKVIPENVVNSKPEYDFRPWAISIIPLTLFSSFNIANNQVGAVVLGVYGLDAENGYYRVAFQASVLLATMMLIIESVIAPYIVQFRKESRLDKIDKVASASAFFSFLLSAPLAIFLFFFGEYFISLLFGNDYVEAYYVLVVLVIGQMIRMFFGSAGMILNMMGKEFYVAVSASVAFLANVIVSFSLAPTFGAVGVSVGSVISMSLWSGFLAFYSYRILKINTTIFGFLKYVRY